MTVHPNGFLYVADGNASGSVGMFSRDANSGLLSGLSPNDFIAAGNYMWYATLGASGEYLYASHFNGFGDAGNDSVYIYNVNTSTGALSLSTTIASQNQPWYVALHPIGLAVSSSLAFAANNGAGTVFSYTINTDTGELTFANSVNVGSPNPYGLAVNSAGTCLYVARTSR